MPRKVARLGPSSNRVMSTLPAISPQTLMPCPGNCIHQLRQAPNLTVSLNNVTIFLPRELKWRRHRNRQGVRALHRTLVRRARPCGPACGAEPMLRRPDAAPGAQQRRAYGGKPGLAARERAPPGAALLRGQVRWSDAAVLERVREWVAPALGLAQRRLARRHKCRTQRALCRAARAPGA